MQAGYIALFTIAFLTGCASYTDSTREIRSLYRSGAWSEALVKLDESKQMKEDKNRLLFLLERAMILDGLGERPKSRAALIEADKVADALYTSSISRTASSLVVSESSSDYVGEDYEKVAIHSMLALSFIEDKDYEAARVEARKINNKLNEINGRYEEKKNKYNDDAFARYLSATIYESKGDVDSAIIDYTKALEAFEGSYREFSGAGVPDELVKALYHLLVERDRSDKIAALSKGFGKQVAEAKSEAATVKSGGSIVVVHELGNIAVKTTSEHIFPIGGQVVRFSFPIINKPATYNYGSTGFSIENSSKFYRGEFVQDLDAIAKQTLEDRRGRYILKQGVRLLAKGQLTEQARQNFGELAGIAANVFTAVSETADTRSWTLLPGALFVTRANVKAGRHDLTIKTDGKIKKLTAVDVKKGEIVILRM